MFTKYLHTKKDEMSGNFISWVELPLPRPENCDGLDEGQKGKNCRLATYDFVQKEF